MPNFAGAKDLTNIARRMEANAVRAGFTKDDPFADNKVMPNQRWRIDERWIEFECGCRAERCTQLVGARMFDPVIFRGLPEQAVYDFVCDFHNASMNVYVHFGHFADFKQWKMYRRAVLMGRVRP